MNTDNMAVSGETIDYGPCAFMNAYDPATVYSGIDQHGRYAYGNQPQIALWNLTRFAETLLPLIAADLDAAAAEATAVLDTFPVVFEQAWLSGMKRKLGLINEMTGDAELINDLLAWMASVRADFTITFRDLSSDVIASQELYDSPEFQAWHIRWRDRMAGQDRDKSLAVLRASNPVVIPRNVFVEQALAAAEQGNLEPTQRLLSTLASPYEDPPRYEGYREPPQEHAAYRTHCGT
jgi:serine/tyrosine/threonine adenylyltransferase